MSGFFSLDTIADKAPPSLIPKCGQCGLYKHCQSPKMKSTGKGRKKILILGESPGKTEDSQGKQFVGDSGQLLRRAIAKANIDMQSDCLITNSLICRPENNKIPNPKMIDWCRPNLIKTINEFQPDVIIPLGATAVKSLIGWVWRDSLPGISAWVGWQIPCQKLNAWICPTWHPAFLLRNDRGGNSVLQLLFEKHLADACSLVGKPWKQVPDYKSQVKTELDCDRAAKAVERIASAGRVSFDFETDRLKPDHDDARIVSCSVSNGKETVAYPWHGEAIEATKNMLVNPQVEKVGYNLKFEDRWVRKILGCRVINWIWDGMVAAHVLDSRKEITSLKFQAFVLLGADSWDGHIKPFLKAKGSNVANRIKELSLQQLLVYNAIDSLLEWKVAKIQMKKLGY